MPALSWLNGAGLVWCGDHETNQPRIRKFSFLSLVQTESYICSSYTSCPPSVALLRFFSGLYRFRVDGAFWVTQPRYIERHHHQHMDLYVWVCRMMVQLLFFGHSSSIAWTLLFHVVFRALWAKFR